MTKSISCRGVILKDAGGAMAPPDFGRSVNLNLNKRGTDYDHLNTTGTPVFSDLPTALIRRQPGSLQSFCSYSAPFFCAIFPIVSTCHPMTLLGAKSYLGLPPPHCAYGFTRLQMSSSLNYSAAHRKRHYCHGGDATAAAVPYRLINPGWELPCHLTKTASKQT